MRRSALGRVWHAIDAAANYTAPLIYGALCWIDAFTGWRPRPETEPDPIG